MFAQHPLKVALIPLLVLILFPSRTYALKHQILNSAGTQNASMMIAPNLFNMASKVDLMQADMALIYICHQFQKREIVALSKKGLIFFALLFVKIPLDQNQVRRF